MKRRGAGTLGTADAGTKVHLEGWIHRRRDLGGVTFLEVRDRSGIVQVVVRPEDAGEAATVLDPVRQEWVVAIDGEVAERSAETRNDKIATGAIEVVARQAQVLSRAEPLPFSVRGDGDDANEETRLKYRFLDLRRSRLQETLALRSRVTIETLRYLEEEGFLNIETPILTRSTPEGARDYLVPSRVHPGKFFALPQSPQIFKQILMVAGYERYVQVARCFRDEDLRADRQPEFTQFDLEMAFVDEEGIYGLIEGLYQRLFALIDVEIETPFPRLSYAEAMLRYGSDKPDLRCDLEICDLTEEMTGSSFRVFEKTIATEGVIRGLRVPGAGSASRKMIDGYSELAQRHGAGGALKMTCESGQAVFQVKGVLSDEQLEACRQKLGLEDGDLALIVAAGAPTAAASLGALRLELAREHGLLSEDERRFLWVQDFPLFEWSPENGHWTSLHHPFTAPQPEDIGLLAESPGKVRSRAYDIVLNGFEIGGGSIRIHDSEIQAQVFECLGIEKEEAEERFGFLLEALRYGAPPHGGIALGVDRLIMLMMGASSLRDVIAFPKTASALCLMTEAPSAVDEEQLQELGVRVRLRPGGGAG